MAYLERVTAYCLKSQCFLLPATDAQLLQTEERNQRNSMAKLMGGGVGLALCYALRVPSTLPRQAQGLTHIAKGKFHNRKTHYKIISATVWKLRSITWHIHSYHHWSYAHQSTIVSTVIIPSLLQSTIRT